MAELRPRPENTRTVNIFNYGVDKRFPLGFVDVVIDNETGLYVGFMQNDNFYPLGANPVEYDKAETIKAKDTERRETKQKSGAVEFFSPSPLGSQFATYKLQVTTDANGQTYVSGLAPGSENAEEHYIYLTPEGKLDLTPINNFDKLRNKIIKDAQATPGGLDSLFTSMYVAGLIEKDTYDKRDFSAPDFNKGLQYGLRNYSINAVDSVELKGAKKIQSFASYLSGDAKGSLKGKTRTSTESFVTKRADAADQADMFFMQYLGRGASKEEEDAYYEALRDLERKNIVSTTAQYDSDGNLISRSATGELVSDLDKTLLLGKIAGTAIKGSKIDKILSAGGQAAANVQDIMSFASQYGITMTQQDALDYVSNNLTKGKSLEQTKTKLIKLAQVKYQNIANLINEDVSVKDIASQYIYDMSNVLEINPQSIDVNDPSIQTALLNNNNPGTMSITEFNTMLRKDPRWGKTKNARDTAATYALDILQSFGLVS